MSKKKNGKKVHSLNTDLNKIKKLKEEQFETKKGDTTSKLANQMALEKNKLKILQIMNGLNMDSEEILPEGTLLKIIVN